MLREFAHKCERNTRRPTLQGAYFGKVVGRMTSQAEQRRVWRGPLLLVLCIATAVILLFLAFGDRIDAWVGDLFTSKPSPGMVAAIAVGLLALDAPLPVPSSVVALGAGAYLGFAGGAAVIFVGLCLGSAVGYGIGRSLGQPALRRFGVQSAPSDLPTLMGPGMLIVTRAVPVLAETATIAAGAMGFPMRRFVPPVLMANAGLALFFAWAGAVALEDGMFLVAFAASVIVPLVGYLIWRRLHRA